MTFSRKFLANSISAIAAISGGGAVSACPAQATDCIEVIGTRPDYSPGFGPWSVQGPFYTGVAGGGSGSIPIYQISLEYPEFPNPDEDTVSYSVAQRHRIDKNGDGAHDDSFGANFLIIGQDYDHDGVPDLWAQMIATYRAWPY